MNKLGVITTHKNYVIATSCPTTYAKITSRRSLVDIKRRRYDNIAKDVNVGLRNFDILRDYQEITIDIEAELIFTRDDTAPWFPKGNYMLSEELYSLPFKNYMGVIMPMELKYEDRDKLVYTSNVIDPVEDFIQFRNNQSQIK